jgi:hypothetical protein
METERTELPRVLGLAEYIAIAAVVVAFVMGTAAGFEHTVRLAHRNGAGNYWDVVTALTVEVLALGGTAMLVAFHRRGWPTRGPFTLIALGVAATMSAQLGYRAAPEPNRVLGYVVAATPTTVALLLIAVAHSAYGYASSGRVEPTPRVREGGVPAATPVPVPLPVPVRAHRTEPVPVPAPPAVPVPARAPEAVPEDEPANAHEVARVREIPINPTTGKPSIRAVRAALHIGQPKAEELIDQAYPHLRNTPKKKPNRTQKNQPVTTVQDHEEAPSAATRKQDPEPPHHRKSLDQGPSGSADGAARDLLHLVREG